MTGSRELYALTGAITLLVLHFVTLKETTSAAGEYVCEIESREAEKESLRIELFGSAGDYWGRVHFRDGRQQILGARVTRDGWRVTTIEDGGWIANITLTSSANRIAGTRNGRAMSCVRN